MVSGFGGDESTLSKQFDVEGIINKPFHLNFSTEQVASMGKLKNSLKEPNGLRFQSLFIFPAFIKDVFTGSKDLIKRFMKKNIRLGKPVVYLKSVAIATVIIITTLAATATDIGFEGKTTGSTKHRISKTAPERIAPKDEKVNGNRPIPRIYKKRVRGGNIKKTASLQVRPDTGKTSPAKETRNALKIVVVEEKEELPGTSAE